MSEKNGQGPSLDSLTGEDIVIYRSVIQQFQGYSKSDQLKINKRYISNSKEGRRINLADKTMPMDLDRFFEGACENGPIINSQSRGSGEFSMQFCFGLDISGIEFARTDKNAVPVIHELDPSVVSGLRAVLVDPDAQREKVANAASIFDPDVVEKKFNSALLTLSEILYDKERQHAAVVWNFYHGMKGSDLGAMLLQKDGDQWSVIRESLWEIS